MKSQIGGKAVRCALTAIGIVMLASCGHAVPQALSLQPEPTTIVYMTAGKENFGSTQIINELAQEYIQTHPQIQFKVESVGNNELSQKVQLLAASNDLPVMFNYQSGEPLLDLIHSGAVLDMQKTFEQLGIADQLNPVAVEVVKKTSDGAGVYALPLELNIEGFWYNKTIFAQYHLEEPRTWDDMLQAAAVLQSHGVQPFAVAGKDKWPITRLINAYAIRKLGADAMERVSRHELKLTDPGFVEAAAMVQQMSDKGYFGPNPNTVDLGSAMRLFTGGKAAMIYTGSWSIRELNHPAEGQIKPDAIGLFSIPLVNGGLGTRDEYPMNAGLTTSFSLSNYNAEVGDFMKYVFARYGERAMDELGMITGFTNDLPSEQLPPLTQMVQEKLKHVTRTSLWFEARFDTQTQLLAWNNAQLLLVDGGLQPVDYMSRLQSAIDK